MILIAPSMLAADLSSLQRQVALAVEGGADWIHIDVMDGHFVPNITFGPALVRAVRKCTKLPLDVHLMIEEPDRYIADFQEAGADTITVHYETCPHLHRTIQHIHQLGAKAGVCVNPATSVSLLTDIIADVDLVLVMSVNPGFGGQSFIPAAVRKIRQAAAMIRDVNPFIHLEVDGGIDRENSQVVAEAGATVIVSGTYVFGSNDIPEAVRTLRSSAEAGAK